MTKQSEETKDDPHYSSLYPADPEILCEDSGHPYARDVLIPDKLKTTYVGACQCGKKPYPAKRKR